MKESEDQSEQQATEQTSRPLIQANSTTKDLSAYFYALRFDRAIKEMQTGKYYPPHTKSLITQIMTDLPNIINCLKLMETNTKAHKAIMENDKEKLRVMALADSLLAKIVQETPDYEIQFVPKNG